MIAEKGFTVETISRRLASLEAEARGCRERMADPARAKGQAARLAHVEHALAIVRADLAAALAARA